MSGVRGLRMVLGVMQAMEKAPTAALRRKAREAALRPALDAERRILRAMDAVETGALDEALALAPGNRNSRNRTVMGPRLGRFGSEGRRPASYQHLVEYGTAPHWQPNRFGGIMHPGAQPKPHVRPAYEETKGNWGRDYLEVIAAGVRAAARAKARRNP